MKNKGITLIALVITIIVLLILAGISIATLTGNEGILTKTTDAKDENGKATAEEQVKLAVMGSYEKNGKLNYKDLKDNLNKITWIEQLTGEITESSFPLTVKVNENEIEIDENGQVALLKETEGVDYSLLEIGDYVNYDVCYDNVETWCFKNGSNVENNGYIPDDKYSNKWRILSKEGEGSTAYIRLVSAGVPLSYYCSTGGLNHEENLTTKFFDTLMSTSIDYDKFGYCGFKKQDGTTIDNTNDLKEVFSNEYTAKYESGDTGTVDYPKVQSLTKNDIDKISNSATNVAGNDLLAIPCQGEKIGYNARTWLATNMSGYLYCINQDGSVSGNAITCAGVRTVVCLNTNIKFIPAKEKIDGKTTWDIEI